MNLLEAAIAVEKSDLTVKEKHKAWEELILSMPDMFFEYYEQESLHGFLRELIDFETMWLENFRKLGKGGVYITFLGDDSFNAHSTYERAKQFCMPNKKLGGAEIHWKPIDSPPHGYVTLNAEGEIFRFTHCTLNPVSLESISLHQEKFLITNPNKFMESQEMRDFINKHYKDEPLVWCRIIAASRASLEDKAAALLELAEHCQADKFYDPKKMAAEVYVALEETKNIPTGSVFMLGEYWRDSDDWNENYGENQTPFATFEQALSYIKEEIWESAEEGGSDSDWYAIERWDLNDKGMLETAVTWHLKDHGTIWGFEFERGKGNHLLGGFNSLYHPDLNVRVPYRAGEIILVDILPFVAPFPAVIAEAEREEYTDCCSPQIVYINQYGKIDAGALKHAPHSYPRFSPLLRLEQYKQSLKGKDIPLQAISEVIKRNPEKGAQLVSGIWGECDRPRKRSGVCWDALKDWDIMNE